eukprot:2495098-Pyramimonas_sp.AAC.1
MGAARVRRKEERVALSFQNKDPTPQDGGGICRKPPNRARVILCHLGGHLVPSRGILTLSWAKVLSAGCA